MNKDGQKGLSDEFTEGGSARSWADHDDIDHERGSPMRKGSFRLGTIMIMTLVLMLALAAPAFAGGAVSVSNLTAVYSQSTTSIDGTFDLKRGGQPFDGTIRIGVDAFINGAWENEAWVDQPFTAAARQTTSEPYSFFFDKNWYPEATAWRFWVIDPKKCSTAF